MILLEGSTVLDVPGWQSTEYSPISDCWRIEQVASSRNEVKPGSVTLAVTTAQVRLGLRFGSPSWHSGPFEMSNVSVLPAITPPTRRSPPSVRPKALEKAILMVLPDSLGLPPAALSTTTATQPITTASTDVIRAIT